jgi:hypothetical protein
MLRVGDMEEGRRAQNKDPPEPSRAHHDTCARHQSLPVLVSVALTEYWRLDDL